MVARVRFTLYAQVGNDELLPLGFRLVSDATSIKRQMVDLLREAADLIEPQAEYDRKALALLKGTELKDCTHCGASPDACEIKQNAAVEKLGADTQDFTRVTPELKAEMVSVTRHNNECCANCQHIA